MLGSFNGDEARFLKWPKHFRWVQRPRRDQEKKRCRKFRSMWLANPFLWEQHTGQNGKQDFPRTWALHVAQTHDLSLSENFQPGLGLRHTHDNCHVLRAHLPLFTNTQPATHSDPSSPLCSTQARLRQNHLSRAEQGMVLQNTLSDNNYNSYHLSSAHSAHGFMGVWSYLILAITRSVLHY